MGFPTVPSRDTIGVPWDPIPAANPRQQVSGPQLNLIAWQLAGLGVGAGGLAWALIKGTDGSKLAGGEAWNPNANPSLSLVLATGWAATTPYGVGALVANGGSLFRATVSGTSAGSGGPSGTGGAIVDGSVTWAYVSTGGYCLRNGTGSYTLVYSPSYPDETGALQPLTLQVASVAPQTTSDVRAVPSVSGRNVVDVRVFNAGGSPVDCNVLVCAR